MKFALIGKNVDYSLSPIIHAMLFNEYGIKAEYICLNTVATDLAKRIQGLKNAEYMGFNVTIPYKTWAYNASDELSNKAKALSSVNTLYYEHNKIIGDNTDAYGFLKALSTINANIKTATILGSGAVAMTIARTLKMQGIEDIIIISRKPQILDFPVKSYDDIINIKADILINASPIGMSPYQDLLPIKKEYLPNFKYVMDTAYSKEKTELEKACIKADIPFADGLYMLVAQAVEAQSLWFPKIEYNKESNIEDIYNNIKHKVYNRQ